ncbi:MAG: hypothetical protein KatS3mg068_0979 [Candidatus Sericytochromatia bacterium]|nr:MAG: hypothetical protein KatS3mg068_0979 [Candidatus Sericytochromatia bacterium]
MTNVNLDNINLNKIEVVDNKNNSNNTVVSIRNNLNNLDITKDTSSSAITTKGNVPASGLSFGKSDNSIQSTITYISDLLQGYSKSDIEHILRSLENLDFSKGLENIDDKALLALAQLNLDLTSKRGIVTITDANGNVINADKFNELLSSLRATLQRAISTNSNLETSSVSKKGFDNISSNIDKDLVNALINTVNEHKKAMDYNEKVVEPLNDELKKNIEKFETLSKQAKQLSEKVDKGISEILALKQQATSIIDNSVSRALTETEKKQLKSIEQSIIIKQQQLIKDSELSQNLINDINNVFSSFESKLNESEKNTMLSMKSALEKKISGQALTVRENFLAGISEEIYKLTSGMSEEQLKDVMTNQELRVKMLASNNKLLDKLMNANNISDFNNSELDEIMKKFKIKVVQEGNKIALYYVGNKDGKETKVSKDDLRQMKTDLNNIVTSPELFTLARATGQISLAYSRDDNKTEFFSNENKSENNEIIDSKLKDLKNNNDTQSSSKNDKEQKEISIFTSQNNKNDSKIVEQSFLQKSLEKKEEEEKYHLKEINKIYERRREINKELENKRLQEKYGIK